MRRVATHGDELARRQQKWVYARRAGPGGGHSHRLAPTVHSLDRADYKYSDDQNCSEAVHREQRLASWLAAGMR